LNNKNNMNTKNNIIIGGVVLVILAFAGGMMYGRTHAPVSASMKVPGNFQSMRAGSRQMGGMVAGQIISKDDMGVTVKLPTGGSKVILMGTSTPVSKTAAGSYNDIVVGAEVVITGSTNTNGSVNATSVQLRPELPTRNQ
jgi:hypothetical protein